MNEQFYVFLYQFQSLFSLCGVDIFDDIGSLFFMTHPREATHHTRNRKSSFKKTYVDPQTIKISKDGIFLFNASLGLTKTCFEFQILQLWLIRTKRIIYDSRKQVHNKVIFRSMTMVIDL